jgi:hypothetical protein
MVPYPRALRIAHHIVYFHAADAQSYVNGKIAEAVGAGKPVQAAEWRKVAHFVDRLLDDTAMPPAPVRSRPAPRYRRARTPGSY